MSLRHKKTYTTAYGTRQMSISEAAVLPGGITFSIQAVGADNLVSATLSKVDSIAAAKQILKHLAPHLLIKPTFHEMPVGTFLHNKHTGTIVKVVEYSDAVFGPISLGDDEVWSVTSDGKPFPAWQDPVGGAWEVVDVEETVSTLWTVKED